MIQIFVDGKLAHDSRLPSHSLIGLTTTTGENKGGLAEITMPPGHPAYSLPVAHRSLVECYRDGKLGFRGRALYPVDDFLNRRKWVCEGELCFLQDGTSRPYLHQDSPANIFTAVIEEYNAQVDAFKRFRVGEITVTDLNDYVRMESGKAEQTLDTVNKLLERCGGYIVFTTAADGARVINWYADPGFRSNQVIEFGENLLDFARDGANTDLATVIFPYGATDPETGEALTIASVNDGLDYLVDEEALALRGWISRPVYWDDVTKPENLLRKAQAWLVEHHNVITQLTLTAIDLSRAGKKIDSFQAGDTIRVRSRPHKVDDDFRLTNYTDNWLFPDQSTITMGKAIRSLTGADVAGDDKSLSDIQRTEHNIREEYKVNLVAALAETERMLTSLIQQTSEAIRMEVSENYTTNDHLEASISSSMTQLSDSFTFSFNELRQIVAEDATATDDRFNEIYSYIRMEGGTLTLGASDSAITLSLENDLIVFRKNGVQFGWWDGENFHTGNIVVEVNERAQFGNFAAIPRADGGLSWLKVKG